MNKSLLILLVTLFSLLFTVSLAQAQTAAVDSVDIQFDCTDLTVTWSHSSGTESGVIFIDAVTLDFILLETFDEPSASYTLHFDPPRSLGAPIFVDVGIFDELGELIAETILTVTCTLDPEPTPESTPEPEPEPPVEPTSIPFPCSVDGRLTFALCQPLVVYPVASESGNGWSIYLVRRGAEDGEFMLHVSPETLAALPDDVAENCTIASSPNGEVVVYLLTSGQYLISTGPDEEGKVFTYLFNRVGSPPVSISTSMTGMPPALLPSCV